MNSFQIKILACVFMAIDHIGAIIYPETDWFRVIGRLSFPLFAFLIGEGYRYSKNVKAYMKRLLIYGIILQIPFSFAFSNSELNIFFTLFLGLCMIYIDDKEKKIMVKIALIILILWIGTKLKVDYEFYGILLIFALYKLKDNFILMVLVVILLNLSVINIYNYQSVSIFSLIFIYLYNNKLGYSSKLSKYGFYLFYPLHLMIIYGISKIIK